MRKDLRRRSGPAERSGYGSRSSASSWIDRAMNHIYSAELARALFEEVGDALFLFDPDTDELLDVNRPAEQLSGFPRAELLSFPATYLFRFGSGGGRGGKDRLRPGAGETQGFHSQ